MISIKIVLRGKGKKFNVNEQMKVKELLSEILRLHKLAVDLSSTTYTFLSGTRLLNQEKYLERTLNSAGITDDATINVEILDEVRATY